MKLKYKANKHSRINYKFMGFTTFDGGWWYNETLKLWEELRIQEGCSYSSTQECKSVKAFRRMLKNAPKGVEFILSSRWVGYDVIGFGTNDKLK